MSRDLYDVAREVTDEVFGKGTYAEMHASNPDPGVQRAILRANEGAMACNKTPPPEHPLHGSGVACHMDEDHEGPCAWDTEPSKARQGIDKLLSVFAHREIESIDSQLSHPIEVYDVDEKGVRASTPYRRWDLPNGPWVLVKFVGGDEYAIWKHTGAVYRVGHDGAVEEDPIMTIEA